MNRLILMLAVIALLCGRASAQETGPIVSEVVVDAPVEKVWAAWTTSEGLRSWLAPQADIDLRLGGLMRANANAQGTLGDGQTIQNAILSFEPGRMLSIKVARPPDGFPFPNAIQRMWTVIYFQPAGPDRTQIRVVSLGFQPDDESLKMRAFFEQGNAFTLEQLRRHFVAIGDRR